MEDQGIGSWIERRTRVAPEGTALISGSVSWTNAELAERVRRLAHGLRGLGVQRGDRVCWLGPNHPAFLETLFAAAKLGAILAPVNHLLDADGIRSIVADSGPRVIVLESPSAGRHVPPGAGVRVAVGGSADPGTIDFEKLIASSPDAPIDEPVGLADLCMMPHTSGTTGPPKGVLLTHGNITWNAVNFLTSTDLRGDDVTIALAPFFRVGGTGVNVLPVLFRGGAVVVPTPRPDPTEVLRLIGEHRVTIGFGNPDLLDSLTRTEAWASANLDSVRYFITGGDSVPERLLRAFLDRGIPCLQGYGLSEAAPLVLVLPPERALDKLGSAGTPPMMVDVRVVRPDGADCRPWETGELLVRGPNVMVGYWNRPEDTASAIDPDGWLHSGDAARVDEDGHYWIVDRLQNAFDTPGGRVYPSDIDRVLLGHPNVVDAACVGVPTDEGMAQAHAFVVRVPGQEVAVPDLVALCAASLPPHAVPVAFTFVDSVPRNSVGKVLRQQLRDLAQ